MKKIADSVHRFTGNIGKALWGRFPVLYYVLKPFTYLYDWRRHKSFYHTFIQGADELPPKQQFEIVIAKYRENISWTHLIKDNMTLYVKSDYKTGIRLPNVGREFGTYLYHIVHHYDQLADRTLFLQGHPFDHPLLSLHEFVHSKAPILGDFCMLEMTALQSPWADPDQQVVPESMRAFLRLIGANDRQHYLVAAWGAQFAVDRDLIYSKPLHFWKCLYDTSQLDELQLGSITYDNHHIGYFFEIFWWQIFTMNTVWASTLPVQQQ